jgi:hypothetical protein
LYGNEALPNRRKHYGILVGLEDIYKVLLIPMKMLQKIKKDTNWDAYFKKQFFRI